MESMAMATKKGGSLAISGVGKQPESKVAVIGDGCFAQGFCNLVQRSFVYDRYEVVIGSIKVDKGAREFIKGLDGIPVVPVPDALNDAKIVVLAIPSAAHAAFFDAHEGLLHNKVVVDVSNPSPSELEQLSQSPAIRDKGVVVSVAERAQARLEQLDSHVVKAFNNISAYQMLEADVIPSAPFFTTAAADDAQALQSVEEFGKAIGIQIMKSIPLAHAYRLEGYQHTFFPTWVAPAFFLFLLLGPLLIFALVRYNVKKGYDWYHLCLQVSNKAVCWLGLWGLALTFIPGALVVIIQCLKRSKDIRVPLWLKAWLDGRKSLGLLSAFCILIHVLTSMLIVSNKYYGKFYDPASGKMNWRGEVSMLLGILGASLLVVTSIGSLPSVSQEFKWREWRFVFGTLPWIAISFGLAHVLVIGIPKQGWTDHSKWPGGLPSITILSSILPMLAIAMKAVAVVLPYVVKLCRLQWSTGHIAVYIHRTDSI